MKCVLRMIFYFCRSSVPLAQAMTLIKIHFGPKFGTIPINSKWFEFEKKEEKDPLLHIKLFTLIWIPSKNEFIQHSFTHSFSRDPNWVYLIEQFPLGVIDSLNNYTAIYTRRECAFSRGAVKIIWRLKALHFPTYLTQIYLIRMYD